MVAVAIRALQFADDKPERQRADGNQRGSEHEGRRIRARFLDQETRYERRNNPGDVAHKIIDPRPQPDFGGR